MVNKIKKAQYGRAGSKVQLSERINWIASFILHESWGELFAGTCAATLGKPSVNWEFLNDTDKWVYSYHKVLQDPRQTEELLHKLRDTAWEEVDSEHCSAIINGRSTSPQDPVELALAFLVTECQFNNRSGQTLSEGDGQSGLNKWKRMPKHIKEMSKRIQDCAIFNLDYSEVLKMRPVNDPKTLIYVAPPCCGAENALDSQDKRESFDHAALRLALDDCQASLLVRCEDDPFIRDLYREADGWIILPTDLGQFLGNNKKRAQKIFICRRSTWAQEQRGTIASESGLREIFDLDGTSLL